MVLTIVDDRISGRAETDLVRHRRYLAVSPKIERKRRLNFFGNGLSWADSLD